MSSFRCIQVNLHHAKGASSVLSRRFAKEQLTVALVQEPWVNNTRVLGLTDSKGRLIYSNTQSKPRTAILLNRVIKFTPITEFIQRDVVAILAEVPTANGKQDMVIASAYFPGDLDDIPPPEVCALVRYCKATNKPFIIGCDANAHHTIWASSDTNNRGEYLLEYLTSNEVNICNVGNSPTFTNAIRDEVLDLTLCSANFTEKVKNWHVSDEPSLSDHRHIIFDIEANPLKSEKFRNPKKTNWSMFKDHLVNSRSTCSIDIRTPAELDTAASDLEHRITDAYIASCPLKERFVCRNVPWWNETLNNLRREARRLFNRAKSTSNWVDYRASLTKYNAELRKAKRICRIKFCEGIQTLPEASRLQKAMSVDHTNGLGQLKREDGSLTVTPRESLQVLMNTHFPGSTCINAQQTPEQQCPRARRTAPNDSILLSRRLYTEASINWALGSFEPMKSPGPDGILPIFLQKSDGVLMPELIHLFRASFTLGYIPESWRKVKVIFIPKAGKKDKTLPKAFRPISLTSTLLKLMEKVADSYIRNEFLKNSPLHKDQHAYQPGKSTETALHGIVTLIEKSLRYQETALCAFLDIEGAFDNTSYASINTALLNRRVDNTTMSWIQNMLSSREITATLGDASITVTATKGCPQGGVLSPLLWSLVVDALLNKLTQLGYEIVGYADDIVLIIRGKCDATMSSRLQTALDTTLSWCTQEGLNINPAKTVIVPFTKRRKHALSPPSLNGFLLNFCKEVKYLGIILDSKLNWTAQIDYAVKKATTAIWACSTLFSKTWGLKPQLALWSYITIARPRITYAALVWWPKVNEVTAQAKLNKVQRLACLSVTSAMRTTPTAALEAMLCLLPLHLHVKKEAELGALRLQRNKTIFEGDQVGHLRILREFELTPLVTTVSDCMAVRNNPDIPYKVIETNRHMWSRDGPTLPSGIICFYTDGSKIGSNTGSGVYGPGVKEIIPMGVWPTVFQAEVYAILVCAKICLKRNYRHAKIGIFSDSQAALLALKSAKCTSKLVWECSAALRELSRQNQVLLYWVPGHCGIEGNENADYLARQGSAQQFIGPEPFLGTSKSAVKRELKSWETLEIANRWNNTQGCRQAKQFISPNPAITKRLLGLKRGELRLYTGVITGHCPALYHLKNIGIVGCDNCRFCNLAVETSAHLLCHCEALAFARYYFFGCYLLTPYQVWNSNPKKVVSLFDYAIPNWGTVLQSTNPTPSMSTGTS